MDGFEEVGEEVAILSWQLRKYASIEGKWQHRFIVDVSDEASLIHLQTDSCINVSGNSSVRPALERPIPVGCEWRETSLLCLRIISTCFLPRVAESLPSIVC